MQIGHINIKPSEESESREENEGRFVTIQLPDKRVLDVFESGNVQLYTHDRAHALEIELPDADAIAEFNGRITVHRLA